jgi:hypothetical protein
MDAFIIVLNILILISLIGCELIKKNYLSSYFNEKGKNLATKEDMKKSSFQVCPITFTL